MRIPALVVAAAAVLAALTAAGCEKPPFSENAPRSPYDRYMTLRGQQRPLVEEDALGNEQPALRQRLKPLGEQ